MLIECSLESLKEYLEKERISCTLEKGTGENPIDYLLIDMGADDKQRPQLIELFALQKDLPNTEGVENRPSPGLPNFLHIQYVLPFEFSGEAVNDIARFLLLINKTLEFSGFGMSEVDRLVYFRHDLYCERSKINTELLKGLLGYLLFIVDSFTPTIEQLALRELSFQQVIDKALSKE